MTEIIDSVEPLFALVLAIVSLALNFYQVRQSTKARKEDREQDRLDKVQENEQERINKLKDENIAKLDKLSDTVTDLFNWALQLDILTMTKESNKKFDEWMTYVNKIVKHGNRFPLLINSVDAFTGNILKLMEAIRGGDIAEAKEIVKSLPSDCGKFLRDCNIARDNIG